MMVTVLVTSLGSVASDVVIKNLKSYGCHVVGCDIYPKEWVVDAFAVDQFYQAPRVDAPERYQAFMEDVCTREKVDYLMPLIDPEVDYLNNHREWFEAHGVTLCIAPKSALDVCRDKKALADFIAERCPLTRSIPTEYLSDLDAMPDWGFPIVAKPSDGRSSQGLRYIWNASDWDSLVETAKGTYVVEPFVKGPIVMVEIVRDGIGETVIMPREELIATPHGCSITVRTFSDETLEADARQLAETLDIRGNVNFEYIRDPEGAYHLVECNPRFSAGTEFAVLSGYDIPVNHLRCFQGKPIAGYTFDYPRVVSRKYEARVTKVELD